MKNVFAFAAAIALACFTMNSSKAAIMLNIDTAVGPTNTVYTLNFSASEGVVAGFEGLLGGGNGFDGPLVQQLAGGSLPTPTTDFNALIDEASDSQFLIGNAQILAATAPFESDRTLGGAFSLQAAARGQSLDMIQIVAANGASVNYNFQVSEAIGAGSQSTPFSGVLGIPEPTSLALFGLGMVGLVGRRRRNG